MPAPLLASQYSHGTAIHAVAPVRSASTVATWTGAADDGHWSNPANWTRLPRRGDTLVFPAGISDTDVVNDLPVGTKFRAIQFAGPFAVTGNRIIVSGKLEVAVGAGNVSLDVPVRLVGTVTVDVAVDAQLALGQAVAGAGGIWKAGGGTLVLAAANTYLGSTLVTDGIVRISNAGGSATAGRGLVAVMPASRLAGNGWVRSAIVEPGAVLAPDPGSQFRARRLTLLPGSVLEPGFDGTAFGSVSSVTQPFFQGAILRLAGELPDHIGASFTLLQNGSRRPAFGTLAGLSDGSSLQVQTAAGIATLTVRYHGGDGNDVAVTETDFRDNIPPTSQVLEPTDGAAFTPAGWPGMVRGAASDAGPAGIHSVFVSVLDVTSGLYWDGTTFGATTETWNVATGTGAWTLALPPAALTDGHEYAIHTRAVDQAGNTQIPPAATSFVCDNSPPQVTVDAPVAGQVVDTGTISGTFLDGTSGVVSLRGALDVGTPGLVRFDAGTGAFNFYTGAADGQHTAHLTGTDRAGNTVSIDVPFIVDAHWADKASADHAVSDAQAALWTVFQQPDATEVAIRQAASALTDADTARAAAYGAAMPPALPSPAPGGIDPRALVGSQGPAALRSALQSGITILPDAVFRRSATLLAASYDDGPWDAMDLWAARQTGFAAAGDANGAATAAAAVADLQQQLSITSSYFPSLALQGSGSNVTADLVAHAWAPGWSVVVTAWFDFDRRFGDPVPLPKDGTLSLDFQALGVFSYSDHAMVVLLDASGQPTSHVLGFGRNGNTLWLQSGVQNYPDLMWTDTRLVDRPSVRRATLTTLPPGMAQVASELQAYYRFDLGGGPGYNEWGLGEVRLYSPAVNHVVNINPDGTVFDTTTQETVATLDPAFRDRPELLFAAVADDGMPALADAHGYTLQETYAAARLAGALAVTGWRDNAVEQGGPWHTWSFLDGTGAAVATLGVQVGHDSGGIWIGDMSGEYLTDASAAVIADLDSYLAVGRQAVTLRYSDSLLAELPAFAPDRLVEQWGSLVDTYGLKVSGGSTYRGYLGQAEESLWSTTLNGWVEVLPDGRVMTEMELLQTIRDPNYTPTLLGTVDRAFVGRLGLLVAIPERLRDRELYDALPPAARAALCTLSGQTLLDLSDQDGATFASDMTARREWTWDALNDRWTETTPPSPAAEPMPLAGVTDRYLGWDPDLRTSFEGWMIDELGIMFPTPWELARDQSPDLFGRTESDDIDAAHRIAFLQTGDIWGTAFDTARDMQSELENAEEQDYDHQYDSLKEALLQGYQAEESRQAGHMADDAWKNLLPPWTNGDVIGQRLHDLFPALYKEAMHLNDTQRNRWAKHDAMTDAEWAAEWVAQRALDDAAARAADLPHGIPIRQLSESEVDRLLRLVGRIIESARERGDSQFDVDALDLRYQAALDAPPGSARTEMIAVMLQPAVVGDASDQTADITAVTEALHDEDVHRLRVSNLLDFLATNELGLRDDIQNAVDTGGVDTALAYLRDYPDTLLAVDPEAFDQSSSSGESENRTSFSVSNRQLQAVSLLMATWNAGIPRAPGQILHVVSPAETLRVTVLAPNSLFATIGKSMRDVATQELLSIEARNGIIADPQTGLIKKLRLSLDNVASASMVVCMQGADSFKSLMDTAAQLGWKGLAADQARLFDPQTPYLSRPYIALNALGNSATIVVSQVFKIIVPDHPVTLALLAVSIPSGSTLSTGTAGTLQQKIEAQTSALMEADGREVAGEIPEAGTGLRNLRTLEDWAAGKGHPEKHVAADGWSIRDMDQTVEAKYLKYFAESDYDYPGFSMFWNRRTAEYVLDQTINVQRAEDVEWLLAQPNGTPLQLHFDGVENSPIGRGFNTGDTAVGDRTNALVVLRRDSESPLGFYVVTAFPVK